VPDEPGGEMVLGILDDLIRMDAVSKVSVAEPAPAANGDLGRF